MKETKNIRRVRQLYIGLLVMVVVMVMLSVLHFVHGASAGMKLSLDLLGENKAPVGLVTDFDVKGTEESLFAFGGVPSYSPDGQVWMYRPNVYSYNVLVGGHPAVVYTPKVWASYALLFFGIACYIAIFVLLFVILGAIRAALRHATVFSRKVVLCMKWLGMAVILGTIAMDVARYLLHLNTIEMMRLCAPESGVALDAGVPVGSLQELFIGLVIIFMAEVFDIGYRMSEEQKLTV